MRKLSYNMNENSPARVRCRPQKGPWFVAACRYNIWFISLPNDINLFSNSMITLAYGCYNLKLRSGILNISKTSIGVPPYQTKCKWSRTAKPSQRHKKIPKKNVGQVWKITIFWRQAALFDSDSMQAITKRFLRGCPRPAPGRYYPFFRLLRASAVQKV